MTVHAHKRLVSEIGFAFAFAFFSFYFRFGLNIFASEGSYCQDPVKEAIVCQ